MTHNTVKERYFEWLTDTVCQNHLDFIKYKSLLLYLNDVEFTYIIEMDENRLKNGEALRWDFAYEYDIDYALVEDSLDYSISVLEVMVSLCRKIEEMMENCNDGCRTGIWFWDMISSMHLENMTNARFDYSYVRDRVEIFLNREYSRDGDGGLFYVENSPIDMRRSELWLQANTYMKSLN